jgi:DNA-binding MarR family transcriptional regulator
MTELLDDVLLTQAGMSRLIARLETAGLVERVADPDDGRAARIRLTAAGADAQRRVGLRHGRHVAQAMTRSLSDDQLAQLRDVCRVIAADHATTGGTRT